MFPKKLLHGIHDSTGHGIHNIVFLVNTVQKEKLSKKGRDKGEGRERGRRDTDREWLIYTGINRVGLAQSVACPPLTR